MSSHLMSKLMEVRGKLEKGWDASIKEVKQGEDHYGVTMPADGVLMSFFEPNDAGKFYLALLDVAKFCGSNSEGEKIRTFGRVKDKERYFSPLFVPAEFLNRQDILSAIETRKSSEGKSGATR